MNFSLGVSSISVGFMSFMLVYVFLFYSYIRGSTYILILIVISLYVVFLLLHSIHNYEGSYLDWSARDK